MGLQYMEGGSTSLKEVQPLAVSSPDKQVAELIGGDITEERVTNLIKKSNELQLVFHGIMRRTSREGVIEKGILPITPEGGFVSFWNTGTGLFYHGTTLNDKIQTLDSSFFNYVPHSLAVSSKSVIESTLGTTLDYQPNGQLTIPKIIPPEALELIFVDLDENIDITGRARGQKIEQTMFTSLEEVIRDGLKPGTIVRKTAQ